MSTTPRTLEYLATTQRVQGSLPVGFNPAARPIIARHVFGVEPFPIGPIAAEAVAKMRFRHRVQHLHRLGPRAVGELLAELGAERSIMTLIDRKLDTYVDPDAEALAATGGADFWPLPLNVVPRT